MQRITKKRILIILFFLFLLLNAVAYTSAYAMTHYTVPGSVGLGKPRPRSSTLPSDVGLSYITHRIPIDSDAWLEAWQIPTQTPPKGTVLLFHGNGGSKAAQLLPSAQSFHAMGYDAWLVDFRGVGGSSDRTTTLGIRESKDVAASLAYAQATELNPPFILYGISLGSVAVLKAVADDVAKADAIIVEQPFYTLLNAVRSRIAANNVPTFLLAELIVFWGSVQHGFNGFSHNPIDDARQITVPTLLLQGEQDRWTTMSEIHQIFEELKGEKQLATFPTAGHDLLISIDKVRWIEAVSQFMKSLTNLTTT